MGKKKHELNIDELLKGVDISGQQEFMTPIKPLKRKMHIKIIGFKDESVKEKLAVKKNESIKEIIVDFNSANREISKIKMVKGEVQALIEFLRLKAYSVKYNSSKPILNNWLNETMYKTRDIDYFNIHERVLILRNNRDITSKNVGVVNIHFKDKLDIEHPYYTGDISGIASCSTTHRTESIKEVLDEVLKQFSRKLQRIRLVANDRVIKTMKDIPLNVFGWYRSSREVDGWFPRRILAKHGSVVSGGQAVLSRSMTEYYSRRIMPTQATRRIRNATHRLTNEGMDGLIPADRRREIRHEVEGEYADAIQNVRDVYTEQGFSAEDIEIRIEDMIMVEMRRRIRSEAENMSLRSHRDEQGVTGEETDFSNLPIGTLVIIEHGNNGGRIGLSDGEERCITMDRVADGNYHVKFDNNAEWTIDMDEIVEVVGSD